MPRAIEEESQDLVRYFIAEPKNSNPDYGGITASAM